MNREQKIDNNRKLSGLYWTLAGLCFAVGVASRVYGAWAGRYISNPDCGIVAIMARHMAEGKEWPIFFYGQAYMGSLEPMISALLCRLFGISGFMVCMGTAVAAIVTLPVIYLWGRDVGGKSSALGALALSAVGPYFYFMFQFAARGGYMVMLVMGLLAMLLSARTAFELQNGVQVKRHRYLLIGLIAGVGWWTNPLIISALLASAAILAFGLRKKIFSVAPLLGLIGFIVGSLPFWLWNAGNNWQSFDMLTASGGVSTIKGFHYLYIRYERLVGLQDWLAPLRMVVMWGYLLLAAAGFLLGIKDIRYNRLSLRGASTLTAGLFVLFSIGFFVRSSFATMNTARYLIPLVPVFAVLIGSFISSVNKRVGMFAASIPVLLLIASYWTVFPDLHKQSKAAPVCAERVHKLQNYLIENDIKAVYSHFMDHSLNFNMSESVVVTTLHGDRYKPYSRKAELTDDVGYLRHYGYISSFLNNTGGTAVKGGAGRYSITYNCKAPEGGLVEVDLKGKCKITDHTGRDCSDELLDRNVNTLWSGTQEKNKQEWVLVTFDNPLVLRRMRLLGTGASHFPRRMKVEILEAGKEEWVTLHENHSVTGYFWSGPRPYWWGRRHRQEYTLKDIKLDSIRVISDLSNGTPLLWQLKEVQFFAPASDNEFDPVQSMPALIKKIQQRNIKRLFADRWESNRVFDLLNGKVRVELNQRAFHDYKWDIDKNIINDSTGVLVRDYDASLTRRELDEAGVLAHEEVIDGWVLFDSFSIESGAAEFVKPLIWTGFTLLSSETWTFDVTAEVKFSDDIVLDGLSVEPKKVRPGEFFKISFCWRKPSDSMINKNLTVFVHFLDDDNMFQSDYALRGFMPEIMGGGSADKDVYYVSRCVQVPKDAALGGWELRMGIYDTLYGSRHNIKTSLKTEKRALVISDIITVIE